MGIIFLVFSENRAMRLTLRQRDFLKKFLELYREDKRPLHYSFIAKKLGIAKVTAYEMLCTLEKLGLVSREYHSRKKPGRSIVKFLPSPEALNLKSLGKEWEEVRFFISRIAENDLEKLQEEFLRELPKNPSPFLFMANLTAITLSAFIKAFKRGQVAELISLLKVLRSPGAITGFVVGLALAGGFSTEMIRQSLADLSEEAHQALADFARELLQILTLQEVNDEGNERTGGKELSDRPGDNGPGTGEAE